MSGISGSANSEVALLTLHNIDRSGGLQWNYLLRESREQILDILSTGTEKGYHAAHEKRAKVRKSHKTVRENAFQGIRRQDDFFAEHDKQTFIEQKQLADELTKDCHQILAMSYQANKKRAPIVQDLSARALGEKYTGHKLLQLYKERFSKEITGHAAPVIYRGRVAANVARILKTNDVYAEKYMQTTSRSVFGDGMAAACDLLSVYLHKAYPDVADYQILELIDLIYVRHYRIWKSDKKLLKDLDELHHGSFNAKQFDSKVSHPLQKERDKISKILVNTLNESTIGYMTKIFHQPEKVVCTQIGKQLSRYFSFLLTASDIKELEAKFETGNIPLMQTTMDELAKKAENFVIKARNKLTDFGQPTLLPDETPIEHYLYYTSELYANCYLRKNLGYLK